MPFTAPIGTVEERETGDIWPGRWFDANPYLTLYGGDYHTGADLNLNFPHFDLNAHSEVCAIGEGKVTFAQRFPDPRYWGNIVVIDHGIVDGKPLFSRYAHVENINVLIDQQVSAGEPIAAVGNGEGLFPYHLHFDISLTDKLGKKPGDWPGSNRARVLADYVDPKEWLEMHVTGGPIRTAQALAQIWYVIATFGLRVRQDHSTSATQVGTLAFGSRVLIDNAETFDQDSYTWGRIRGGMYNGDFLAMGKSDQSETYLSRNPPGR